MTVASTPSQSTQLRIGLVCYGGVSLAIYMHGVTKELFKLVRASRAFDAQLSEVGDAAKTAEASTQLAAVGDDSERAYYEALRALAIQGTPISVVIDVIAGTSAGGINGVCLARGLAHNRSLDNFRSLWLDEGDLEILMGGRSHPRFHDLFLAFKLAHAAEQTLRNLNKPRAPLDGSLMSRLLYQAFDGMDQLDQPGSTLIVPGESLELYVTTTDLRGYDSAFATGSGGISHTDREYRQVLGFTTDSGPRNDFDDIGSLSFAARATSSFPGAFPPISLEGFCAEVGSSAQGKAPTPKQISDRFFYGGDFGWKPEDAWFVDGGVLDNGPFDHVVEAISKKRAFTKTDRQIIFIEPDPSASPGQVTKEEDEPTWLSSVWGSKVAIHEHNSLAVPLEALSDMNQAIADIGEIAELQLDQVLPEPTLSAASKKKYADVTATAAEVRAAAKEAAGLTYGTYCRLRAVSVAGALDEALRAHFSYPQRSNRSIFVSAVATSWIQGWQGWTAADPTKLEEELGAVDLPFRMRRVQFLLQGINALFDATAANGATPPPRRDLIALKAACWDLLQQLEGMSGRALQQVSAQLLAVLGPDTLDSTTVLQAPNAFAKARTADLKQLFTAYREALQGLTVGSSESLWTQLEETTRSWDEGVRLRLLSRYLAFPVWDTLIFPIISLARLPQLSPIGVSRFSPLDAQALQPVDDDKDQGRHKLRGTVLAHFGGFFEEGWRENDYLWGRLDGVEMVMNLLKKSTPDVNLDGPLTLGLQAVLASETSALKNSKHLVEALERQVSARRPQA
jgi:patatin-related protein